MLTRAKKQWSILCIYRTPEGKIAYMLDNK